MGILLGNKACAGFPSPADDLGAQRIDLTELLMTHPQATYFLRANGPSMTEAGILHNDIMVINRALQAKHNRVVVAVVDGCLTVKYWHDKDGCVKLKSSNPAYADIVPKEGQTFFSWGVVKASITLFPD